MLETCIIIKRAIEREVEMTKWRNSPDYVSNPHCDLRAHGCIDFNVLATIATFFLAFHRFSLGNNVHNIFIIFPNPLL